MKEMGLKHRLLTSLWCVITTAFAGIFFSCSDNEDFTDSPARNIFFSQDTISFDTIFTGIGSATKEFTIHNPNSKGVRLSSVRLGSNGSSGFRVNLDGHFNTQFNDVEIFHEDSIFCFVEVTINPHDSDSPILLTDSLLFTLSNGVTRKVVLQAYGQDVIPLHALTIQNDTTITVSRPIVVYDSLVVASDATLTISPGTTLCFHKGAGLNIHGRIICDGTLEQPIIMRGDRTDRLLPKIPYDLLTGQWKGILLYPESHQNVFNYCDIHSGEYGIIAPNEKNKELLNDYDEDQLPKYTITNTIIHNVSGDGIFLQRTKADIYNTQISNAGNYCANIVGGTTRFYHCTLAQFYPWNYGKAHALFFTNTVEQVPYPLNLIEFTNSIITGSADDEIYGRKMPDNDAAFRYNFVNSLICTVITDDDAENFLGCIFEPKPSEIAKQKESDTKKLIARADHFRLVSTENYLYDFRLDTLSTARGLGNGKLTPENCRYDLRGNLRPIDHPDAGCFQFVEEGGATSISQR